MKIPTCLFCCALVSSLALSPASAAQTANPLSSSTKAVFDSIRSNVLKAAEEMPEASYGFKPVDSVRTFGELVAHQADGQYEFCSAVAKEKKSSDVEKTVKGKAELVKALKTAFSYCDQAYSGMTDAEAAKQVSFFGRPMVGLAVLNLNTAHTDEHYGNMVTYMRMKGLVPPSSKQ
jgi:uncharacterized damage-inducible protein DinB